MFQQLHQYELGAVKKAKKPTAKKSKTISGGMKATLTADIPAGSTIQINLPQVTRLQSAVATIIPLYGIYDIYNRANTDSGKSAIRSALESSGKFVDVTITASTGGGTYLIDARTNSDWYDENSLRDFINNLVSKAGYKSAYPILKVKSLPVSAPPRTNTQNSTGQIRNNAAQKNQKISEIISNTGEKITDKAIDSFGDGVSGFMSNLGITTPIALVGAGIVLLIVLKK